MLAGPVLVTVRSKLRTFEVTELVLLMLFPEGSPPPLTVAVLVIVVPALFGMRAWKVIGFGFVPPAAITAELEQLTTLPPTAPEQAQPVPVATTAIVMPDAVMSSV